MKLFQFERTTNAFNYVFEKEIPANETIVVKMPVVSANKRGINDIGWASNGDITLYGTLEKDPYNAVLWQEIRENDEVNKTTSFLKIKNNGVSCKVVIRAIFN